MKVYIVYCYIIKNWDQGNSKAGQEKSVINQGIYFLKLCGHPVLATGGLKF